MRRLDFAAVALAASGNAAERSFLCIANIISVEQARKQVIDAAEMPSTATNVRSCGSLSKQLLVGGGHPQRERLLASAAKAYHSLDPPDPRKSL